VPTSLASAEEGFSTGYWLLATEVFMSVHIVPRKTYFLVFAALLACTGLTVFVATIPFGRMNDVVAMTVAVTKMMLVLLFFMHVRYSSRLIWVIVASMFFWLLILLLITLTDYSSRGWFGPNVTV
jgi:cytochrome c oxidase subunit 4